MQSADKDGKRVMVTETMVSLLDGGTIRRVPLSKVSGVSMKDKYLQEQLIKNLAQNLRSRYPVKKATGKTSMCISALDGSLKKEDSIKVSYIGKTQEWKCSYRLEMPAESSDKSEVSEVRIHCKHAISMEY